ncbi:hypothetical protein [Bradyrhizobium sp. GM2.2]|uniref:hypothetical protein n=1 Tax=Bradyrhizobium sp. GM2.2 TaxID=3156358 RepID=UPI00339736F3
MWWSATVLPIFRSSAPARDVVDRIIDDKRFKPGLLSQVLARLKSEPERVLTQATFARALALVNARTAEEAVKSISPEQADEEAAAAENRVRTSLTLNPTDSFLWLLLYSLASDRNGFDREQINWLDQSYATGPREGWIALRRNRLALSLFTIFSHPAQERVVSEFAELVDSEFIEDAALNLSRTGWPHRERLLSSLQRADITTRERLAKVLSQQGIKVTIPGVQSDERPWR